MYKPKSRKEPSLQTEKENENIERISRRGEDFPIQMNIYFKSFEMKQKKTKTMKNSRK